MIVCIDMSACLCMGVGGCMHRGESVCVSVIILRLCE